MQVLINKWTTNVFWGHSFQVYDMDISVVCASLVFICCMILEIQLLFTIFGTQSELPCVRLNLSVHWGQHNKIHCFTGNFFQPKPCVLALFKKIFLVICDLCTIHSMLACSRGSQARLVMFRSADRFQYSYPISDRRCSCCGNGKSRVRETNLSFEKVVSWQDIRLENYAWYGPEDTETTKHPPKKCRIKPALLSTCCCANSFNGCELIHGLLQILLPKRPSFFL